MRLARPTAFLAALGVLALAGGCGDPGTSVRVTVAAHGAIALSTLSVAIGFDEADPGDPLTVLDGSAQVTLPADLVVGLPDRAMDVQLHLAGQDVQARAVSATGLVRSMPRQQVRLSLTLSGSGVFDPDVDGGVDLGEVDGDDTAGSIDDLALPPCQNGVRDGAETDVDCGGGTCAACSDGLACAGGADCASTSCVSGICKPLPCGGVVCGPNESCPTSGTCACGPTQKVGGAACTTGQTCCAAGCFDLMTSAAHCGSCTNACLSGETCVGGTCKCGSNPRCPAGTECNSNRCKCKDCNGCCVGGANGGNDQCVTGTTASQCGPIGGNCTSCSGRTDTCANRTCVCNATGSQCPSSWTCEPDHCAPDSCEAITGQGGTDGIWFTSGSECSVGCAAPATCLFKSDCQGYPCPGGHCYKCI